MYWTRLAALAAMALALFPNSSPGQCDSGMFVDSLAFPQQGMAKVNGQFVEIEHAISRSVCYIEKHPVTESYTVEVDGKQETRTATKYVEVTKCKQVTVMEKMAFTMELIQVWDTEGAKVDAAKARKRLEAGETVLFANRKVPSYYLSVFKPETLVLQFTPYQVAMPAPGAVPEPPPAPVPVPRIVPPAAAPVPAPAAPAPRPVPADAPSAEAPAVAPAVGPSPTVKLAALTKSGIGLRTYVKNVSTNTAMMEKVDGEGKKEMIPYSIETESIQDIELRYPLAALKIMTAEGKEVAEADLPKLLEKPRCVLVSADGQAVSKEWLKIVRPEALIVVPPPAAPPLAISAPAPAPAPVPVPLPATP
ncbi:MAG: hypothetical protein ACKVP0_26295 [Pirellulaceae bacterium]